MYQDHYDLEALEYDRRLETLEYDQRLEEDDMQFDQYGAYNEIVDVLTENSINGEISFHDRLLYLIVPDLNIEKIPFKFILDSKISIKNVFPNENNLRSIDDLEPWWLWSTRNTPNQHENVMRYFYGEYIYIEIYKLGKDIISKIFHDRCEIARIRSLLKNYIKKIETSYILKKRQKISEIIKEKLPLDMCIEIMNYL